MTAALTKALAMHDPEWMSAGLDKSYLRTIRGVMYAVLIARNGAVLAVYRVSRKRMNVQIAEFWPRVLVEELQMWRSAGNQIENSLVASL